MRMGEANINDSASILHADSAAIPSLAKLMLCKKGCYLYGAKITFIYTSPL